MNAMSKTKPFFHPVISQPNLPRQEEKTLGWWNKSGLAKKYLQKNKNSKKKFSFIDGPITANNPMGVHHARGRALKDVFQRYKNLQGFRQRFQNGFDCQGLWVEVEVEKEFGFNSKKDIEKFGIDKFTNACKNRVRKYASIQTEQSKRLGMFMDWDNSYYTMSTENNLHIWHFLKIVADKNWLSKEKTSSTWCPRCETGLSQHEQADGYREITDTSLYVKFKLKNRKNEYLLAWTTTPWTLSANVLLAINSEHKYVKVTEGNNTYYLAKDSAQRLGFKKQEPVDPKKLLNLEYESLYDIPVQKGVRHYVVEWELVDPIEGTGIVHVAPGCGAEDFDLGKELGTDLLAPLDESGHFLEGYQDLTGKYAHDVSDLIIKHLKNTGAFYRQESITHRYPFCWRCGTKCLFRLENNWFLNCEEIRPHLKKAAQKATWLPKYAGKRMQNWLDNMGNWMISRKRFYGLSLPFYECSCKKLTVIGSLEEFKKLAVDPEKVDKLPSLHRPWIDDILIHCPHCQKKVKRIPDVGDCWLDAGIVPFSTLKYLSDKKYWKEWFPADFICEMTEQVRLWYYSMLFQSVVLENKIPYKSVLNYSEVRDEKGDRMSKTKKNGISFDDAVEKIGADAMRWLYCSKKSHLALNFGYSITDQVKRNFILLFWNIYKFFVSHADNQNWTPAKKTESNHVLDRWILSRLHNLIKKTTESYEKYDTPAVTSLAENFINDLSTWYIRRSRNRPDCLPILHKTLKTLSVLIAPITPFLSEEIYQNLSGSGSKFSLKNSIHLQNWPQVEDSLIDPDLEEKMDLIRKLTTLGHQQRQKEGIRVRQPLNSATLFAPSGKNLKELENLLREELNVKKLIWKKKQELAVNLDTKLTPELISEGQARDIIRKVQILRKEKNLGLKTKIKLYLPEWPKEFTELIKKKTLTVEISKSISFKIETI